MSEEFLKVQCETDGEPFEVAYSILSPEEFLPDAGDPRRAEIMRGLENAEAKTDALERRIAEINQELEKYTNTADKLDYTVAVASGVLCGLIDVFIVGETDIAKATDKADKAVADMVKKQALDEKIKDTIQKAKRDAEKKGRILSREELEQIKEGVTKKFWSDPNNIAEQGGDPVLKRAIRYLEEKHPVLQDNLYKGTGSRPESHHLDDIAHHPTLAGLVAAIVVQFFRVAAFVNKDGKWSLKLIQTDPKEMLEIWLPILLTGLFNWLINIAEKHCNENGETSDIPKPIFKLARILAHAPAAIQILRVANDWCMHFFSDMAGSKGSKGRGAGIPGLFISFLKEVSSLPGLSSTELSALVDKLYTTQRIDMRAEIGIVAELGRQAVPVIINEVLVRGFYFVRRLVMQYKENNGWDGIDWRKVVPFNNRTIVRMMTIASGTFTAIDMAGAAIQGAAKSGGNAALFAKEFLLNVNFVGVGRFVIAVGADVAMGIKAGKLRNERLQLSLEMMHWTNTKVFYTQANMWISAENAQKALIAAYQSMEVAYVAFANYLIQAQRTLDSVDVAGMEQHNPGLVAELLDLIHE